MKEKKFRKIREEIRRKRELPENQWSYKIGKEKKRIVMSALGELKKEEKIICFFPTSDLSYQDIVEGKDMFVGYFNGGRRRVLSFSFSGKKWVEKDREKHPEEPAIVIYLSDTSESIKSKIMEVIGQNK